jgi:hypothetical protein
MPRRSAATSIVNFFVLRICARIVRSAAGVAGDVRQGFAGSRAEAAAERERHTPIATSTRMARAMEDEWAAMQQLVKVLNLRAQ